MMSMQNQREQAHPSLYHRSTTNCLILHAYQNKLQADPVMEEYPICLSIEKQSRNTVSFKLKVITVEVHYMV